jgi:pimeloyl-ACP methyl ester carboxylesterase
MYERFALFSRLIMFDKRGTGLSDRPRDLGPLETRMDDIRAVLDAVGAERTTLVGLGEGGQTCALFAATYPERTEALVLVATPARVVRADDYPYGTSGDEWRAKLREIRERWGTREYFEATARAIDPSAAPGEVLVSSTVKDLVAASGIEFEDRGTHELKGVPGEWRLYAVGSA